MTTMITELYEALKQAGADDDTAKRAAQAVIAVEAVSELATKAGLAELKAATKAELAELKADLIKWMVGLLFAQAAFIIALLKL